MSAVPSALMYQDALRPRAPKASVNRVSFQPDSGGTFSASGQNVIRIPIQSASQFLDTRRSHVRMNLSFTATTNTVYLRSVYSLIDRVRVLSGSNVLEDIPRFGQIVNRYIDLFLAQDQRAGQYNLALPSGQGNSGAALFWGNDIRTWVKAAAGTTTSGVLDFPLPLLGVMNMTSSQHGQDDGLYLPLPLMQPIYLEITLRNNNNDMFYTVTGAAGTVSNVTISQVSYEGCCIDFGPEVVQRLKDSVMAAGGKVFVSTSTYQVSVLSSATQAMNLTVATRARSVKGIANITQLVTQAAGSLDIDYDASIFDNTSEWYLLANGVRYPQQPLTKPSDYRRHLEYYAGKPLKGIGAVLDNFNSDDVTPSALGDPIGSFMAGVDLESKSGQDFIEGGYNAAEGASQITINHTMATAQAKYVTVLVHVDGVLVIDALTKDCSMSI